MAVPGYILSLLLGTESLTGTPRADLQLQLLDHGITIIIGWLYEAFFTASTYQATPGKMIVGIRVIDQRGNRISFARATGRHFAKFLSAIILAVGYIMAAFDEQKRALHDHIAGTLVTYKSA
jgi:uncharacterized RDD family membrane protein YckC